MERRESILLLNKRILSFLNAPQHTYTEYLRPNNTSRSTNLITSNRPRQTQNLTKRTCSNFHGQTKTLLAANETKYELEPIYTFADRRRRRTRACHTVLPGHAALHAGEAHTLPMSPRGRGRRRRSFHLSARPGTTQMLSAFLRDAKDANVVLQSTTWTCKANGDLTGLASSSGR